MIIDGNNQFMGAYDALKPKADYATLQKVDEDLRQSVTDSLNAAFKELNPFRNSGATMSISQETLDFFTSDNFYERVKKDTEELYQQYFNQQNSIAASLSAENPFRENTGTQWMVFSKLLYDNGFYDGMDIDEVKEKENILKSITAGMDSVGRNTYNSFNFFHDMDNANSYNGNPIYMTSIEARMDLASSASALMAFADKFLEGDEWEQFYKMADEYTKHNSVTLENYRNINEVFAGQLNATRASILGSAAKNIHAQAEPEIKYYFELGGIKHSEEEKEKFQLNMKNLFEKFRIDNDNHSLWNNLNETFVNFMIQNSDDEGFRNYVGKQSENTFNRINEYWSKLLA